MADTNQLLDELHLKSILQRFTRSVLARLALIDIAASELQHRRQQQQRSSVRNWHSARAQTV